MRCASGACAIANSTDITATLPTDRLTRVLFYLPVVTPWWFERIIIPLVKALSLGAEVHVMVPPLWSGTGIGRANRNSIASVKGVFWHLLDGPDHARLRTDASGEDDLFALIDQIAPDITLCRTADIAGTKRIPGDVLYIMEGGGAPLGGNSHRICFTRSLFDFAEMPELTASEIALCERAGKDFWTNRIEPLQMDTREAWRERLALPDGKTLFGLPLEYEHEENFFGQHHAFPSALETVKAVVERLPDDAVLLVTHHPLTERHGNVSAVNGLIADLRGRAILIEAEERQAFATWHMCRHCDGMIIDNTKSWSVAAAFGTPILRLSRFGFGDWVQEYRDMDRFFDEVGRGVAKAAALADVQRWFGYHVVNVMFDPRDPGLTAEDVLARASREVMPETWEARLSEYNAELIALAADIEARESQNEKRHAA